MAFYKTEKACVVVDVGSTYIRVGVAGEAHPRAVLAAELGVGVGQERRLTLSPARPSTFQRGSDPEWREAVGTWLRETVLEVLQVEAGERRLVVCEDVDTPSRFRNALAHAALGDLAMVSLLMVPAPAAALLPLGLPTALVVDVGGCGSRTLPVVDSMPLLSAAGESVVGGHVIDANVARLLGVYAKERGVRERPALLVDLADEDEDEGLDDAVWPQLLASDRAAQLGPFPRSVIEDFKVKACFVALGDGDVLEPGAALPPPTDADIHLACGLERVYDIKGAVRTLGPEVLFHSNNAAEVTSLPELVLDTLLRAPVDERGTLAQNIVVVGGTANLPGLHRRLLFELDRILASTPKYASLARMAGSFRIVPSPYKPDHVAWTGTSILASTVEYLPQTSITRDEYVDSGRIPDWARIGSKDEFAHLFHDL